MRIGELATRTGCEVETIHYYEREGPLLPPRRGEGNYRQYGKQEFEPELACNEINVMLDAICRRRRRRLQYWRGQAQLKDLRHARQFRLTAR